MVDCEKKNNISDISISILEKRSILKYAFFPILLEIVDYQVEKFRK